MNKRTTILLFLLISFRSFGQQMIEPLDLAKKIFSPKGFEQIALYSTDEYQGEPNGTQLNPVSVIKFESLYQQQNMAVIAMTIMDTTQTIGWDTYLFFTKDSNWKMSAFRALALTGMVEMAKNELESLTDKQVDSLIVAAKKDTTGGNNIFSSRESFDYELGNIRLTLALDRDNIAFFNQHKPEFEKLRMDVEHNIKADTSQNHIYGNAGKGLEKEYRKLFLNSISATDGYLDFSIGGITDNTVGWWYVKDKKALPHLDPSSIIMIREIGGGWYLYKTT